MHINKYIKSMLSKLFPKELPKPMGRWRIEDSHKQINHKIDLSNEDHCGPCGQYALSQINLKNKVRQELKKKEDVIPIKKV